MTIQHGRPYGLERIVAQSSELGHPERVPLVRATHAPHHCTLQVRRRSETVRLRTCSALPSDICSQTATASHFPAVCRPFPAPPPKLGYFDMNGDVEVFTQRVTEYLSVTPCTTPVGHSPSRCRCIGGSTPVSLRRTLRRGGDLVATSGPARVGAAVVQKRFRSCKHPVRRPTRLRCAWSARPDSASERLRPLATGPADHKARQALTYVHSRSRRPSGAAMRMVRLSRDASKQDEARELLAPVYRSVEPRPSSSLIHRQCLDRSFLCANPLPVLRAARTVIDS